MAKWSWSMKAEPTSLNQAELAAGSHGDLRKLPQIERKQALLDL
jgi:hypothetical protein